MKGTCPECGFQGDVIAFFVEGDARLAVAEALRVPSELGPFVLRYLALFRPPQRALSLSKATRLLRELADAIEEGKVERRGRAWSAPIESWRLALRVILEQRVGLTLPLKNHHYLYEIVAGIAHQAEGVVERQTEERRQRGQHREAPPPATADPVQAQQLVQQTLAKLRGESHGG